jgi:hypothetical protein
MYFWADSSVLSFQIDPVLNAVLSLITMKLSDWLFFVIIKVDR